MGGIWNILGEQTDLKNEKKYLGDQTVINSYVKMLSTVNNLELNPISYVISGDQFILETKSNWKVKLKSWRPTSQVFQSGDLARIKTVSLLFQTGADYGEIIVRLSERVSQFWFQGVSLK